MRLLLCILALSGCAAAGPQTASAPDDRLTREIAGRVAGEAERCISSTSSSEALRVIDARTLIYRSGRTLWVNRLERDCPGLRSSDALIVEITGSQYCAGDRFREFHPNSSIPGPYCVLNEFTPYRRPR